MTRARRWVHCQFAGASGLRQAGPKLYTAPIFPEGGAMPGFFRTAAVVAIALAGQSQPPPAQNTAKPPVEGHRLRAGGRLETVGPRPDRRAVGRSPHDPRTPAAARSPALIGQVRRVFISGGFRIDSSARARQTPSVHASASTSTGSPRHIPRTRRSSKAGSGWR